MADENDDKPDAEPTEPPGPADEPDAADPAQPGPKAEADEAESIEPGPEQPSDADPEPEDVAAEADDTDDLEADGSDEPESDATAEPEAVGADGPAGDETTEFQVGDDELGEVEGDDGGESEGEAAPAGRKVAFVGGIVVGVLACLVAAVLWAGSGGDDDPDDDTPATEELDSGDEADDTTDTSPPADDEPAEEQEAAAVLSDLEPVENERWETDESGDVTIGGETYADTVVSGPIGGCDDGAAQVVEYALGGNYTRLSGTVGLADTSPPNLGVEITFEADGAELYWRSFVQGDASRVQLDLTGVQQLTITAARVFTGDECVQAAFANLALT